MELKRCIHRGESYISRRMTDMDAKIFQPYELRVVFNFCASPVTYYGTALISMIGMAFIDS